MYRQQIVDMGIEDMEINVSSLQKCMSTLETLNDMELVLKQIKHNLRSDMRRIRLDYIKMMKDIEESSDKKGLFGRKMSLDKILEKKRSLKKERRINMGSYEMIENMLENYLTQIDDSRRYIRNHIQRKVQ